MSKLTGYHLAAFESRMRLPMERLIEGHGGIPHVGASMKEVPLSENHAAQDFYHRLKIGGYDLTILLTGVATRYLIQALEQQFPKPEIIANLSQKTKIVCRGPKPQKVCNILEIPIAYRAPEPNTWREIIALLKDANEIAGKHIAIIEYGISNAQFLTELEGLGAQCTPIHVYAWALPDDLAPLNRLIDEIIAGEIDIALFTTQIQVVHLFQLAQGRKLEAPLRRQFGRIAIGSIGPTTSERLHDYQIFPDFEASPNKMDQLVSEAADLGPQLHKRKQTRWERCQVRELTPTTSSSRPPDWLSNPIMRALRHEPHERIPIWLMRQAGRYMAEYQIIRTHHSFLEMCQNPALASEVTISAIERLGVDAAIIFSDILIPLLSMGLDLQFHEGLGPVIANPVRDRESLEQCSTLSHNPPGYVYEAIQQTRAHLKDTVPLIGFVGAPFTVAAYMIEGRASRQFIPTKTLMHSEPEFWYQLMTWLTDNLTFHANEQVRAGCQILQVFDSWANALTAEEYTKFVLPYSQRLIKGIVPEIPVIHFGSFDTARLPLQSRAGGHALGLHWAASVDQAITIARQSGQALQGNIDPVLLFSKPSVFLPQVERLLNQLQGFPGFVFNLGHGILPETPVNHVLALVDYVHAWEYPY